MARHGGGAFSGKDCTKVDRTAAYAARYAAKNVVAAGLAKKCEIQLSYAIGVACPTSIRVDTFGTGKVSDEKLVEILRENFDFRPAGMIKMLDLRRLHPAAAIVFVAVINDLFNSALNNCLGTFIAREQRYI